MKVFLSSDMEGTAGVVDWEQCVGDGPRDAARPALLLAEVNAAIEGALAGGATEIVVNDSHSTMRNLPPRALAGGASYISGSHKPLYMMQGLDDSFDTVPVRVLPRLGRRARAGCRTPTTPARWWRCASTARSPARPGINALVAAHYGVPVVLVTGDRVACEETAALMPGVHQAIVKEHVSRLAAHSLHPDAACELIREKAEAAAAGARGGRGAAAGPGRAGGVRPHHRHRRGGDLGARRGADRPAGAAHPGPRPAGHLPLVLLGHPADPHGRGGCVSGPDGPGGPGAGGGGGSRSSPAPRAGSARRSASGSPRTDSPWPAWTCAAAMPREWRPGCPAPAATAPTCRDARSVRAAAGADPRRAGGAVAAGQRGRACSASSGSPTWTRPSGTGSSTPTCKGPFLTCREFLPAMIAAARRLHRQHRLDRGRARRPAAGGLLRVQGRAGAADAQPGDRPRAGRRAGQLRVPGPDRHRDGRLDPS